MKTLLIMRHAKSSWADPAVQDRDRPLNARGKRDAPRMGRLLGRIDSLPDLIITSDAKRARGTAKRVAKAVGYEGRIVRDTSLYAAGPASFLAALREVDDRYDTVLVVGHNPGIEALVHVSTGDSVLMPTGAIVRVVLDAAHWRDVDDSTPGKLRDHWLPKKTAD